jgi:nitrite transporter NirC
MAYNLLWVTLGNMLGGSLFMALGYWLYSRTKGYRQKDDGKGK